MTSQNDGWTEFDRFAAPTHYDTVQTLILSPSCPKSVLALCSPKIMILLADKKRQPNSFNVPAIRQAVADAIGVKGNGDKSSIGIVHPFSDCKIRQIPSPLTCQAVKYGTSKSIRLFKESSV